MILIIHGPPAAGKTTIATFLADRLGLPLFGTDRLAEWLHDAAGERSDSLGGVFGGLSYELMFRLLGEHLRADSSAIFEACLNPVGSRRRIEALRGDRDVTVVEIFVFAEPAALVDRYRARADAGARHAVHGDERDRAGRLEAHLAVTDYAPLGFAGERRCHGIELDTTRWDRLDLDALAARLSALGTGGPGLAAR